MHHALHKLEEKAKPDEKELFEKLCKVFESLEEHFPIRAIHGEGKVAEEHGGGGGAVFIKNLAGGRIAIKNAEGPEEEPEPEPKHGHVAKLHKIGEIKKMMHNEVAKVEVLALSTAE